MQPFESVYLNYQSVYSLTYFTDDAEVLVGYRKIGAGQ